MINKGNVKHHSDKTKQKMTKSHKGKSKKKYRWVTYDGKIVKMAKANAQRWHPEWILLID